MNRVERVVLTSTGTAETRARLIEQISRSNECAVIDFDYMQKRDCDSVAIFDCSFFYETDLIRYILGSDFETKNVKFGDFAWRINDRLSDDFEQANVEHFRCAKDNKKLILEKDQKPVNRNVQLVEVTNIIPIEAHDPDRVEELTAKITDEALWKVPVIIEGKDGMLLDGHHRLEVAKKLGLARIPALVVDYDKIDVWSLRENEGIIVDQNIVRTHAAVEHQIYPYKTVKHKYPFQIPEISYSLEVLS